MSLNWLKPRTVVYARPQKPVPTPRRFHIGRILWAAVRRTCTVIGAVILVSAIIGTVIAYQGDKKTLPVLPDDMILTFDLDGHLREENAMSQYLAMLNLGEPEITLDKILDGIEAGAKDPRVKALAVRVSGGGYDITQIQELRRAVKNFRSAGKKAYIYAESYGESGSGLGLYYFASAFDSIWLQPVGTVAVGGISMEMPFFKDLMEKYGVEAQFYQRKEYKNAMEHLTSSSMSKASRESMEGLLHNLSTQLTGPIKTDRKKLGPEFDSLMNQGLFTDSAALAHGFVDRVDYEDTLIDELGRAYKGADPVGVGLYMQAAGYERIENAIVNGGKAVPSQKISVAVIPVEGMIVSGRSGGSPYGWDEKFAAADDISDAIREAADDKKIRAIVLRVNSPGGSPSASETIARAVHYARITKKKKLYVSMGGVAASGGYWISAGADRIYAMDGTLTGSIGVVGGKVNLQKLWGKFDVRWETVQIGENAGMMSMNKPFSDSERVQFELSLDNVYNHFIDRVAKGRHMTPAQVEAVAKGHVWTGQQALEKGLVDKIGGLNLVLDDIAKESGLASRNALTIHYLPRVENPFDIFFGLLGEQASLSGAGQFSAVLKAGMTAARISSQISVLRSSPQMVYDPSLSFMSTDRQK